MADVSSGAGRGGRERVEEKGGRKKRNGKGRGKIKGGRDKISMIEGRWKWGEKAERHGLKNQKIERGWEKRG